MSYPDLAVGGDLNHCWFYLNELKHCADNSLFPKTHCKNEREDFLECHTR
jgi:hypothetical protein